VGIRDREQDVWLQEKLEEKLSLVNQKLPEPGEVLQ
jgi:hypothetical protein